MTRYPLARTATAVLALAFTASALTGCIDNAKGDELVDKLIEQFDRIDTAIADIKTKEDVDKAIATIDDVNQKIRELGKEGKDVRVTQAKYDELEKKMEAWGRNFQKTMEAHGMRLGNNPEITEADLNRIVKKMNEIESAMASWDK